MDRNFFAGMIIGAAVGAAVALIYAPMPGTETREVLTEQSKRAAERVGKAAETMKSRAREVGESVKQAM